MADTDFGSVYRQFFEEFARTVELKDPLPIRVASYDLAADEMTGEIIESCVQYLTEKKCPQSLMVPIIKTTMDDIRKDLLKNPQRVYESLRVMKLCTSKVDEICLRYCDNEKLSSLPPPVEEPHFSHHGIKHLRRTMEDRLICLPRFNSLYNIKSITEANYYGLFDGHGGSDAASFAASHLHQFLAESQHYPSDPVSAFREAYAKTDSRCETKKLKGGTTAVAVLHEPEKRKLIVSWVGDSQAMLVSRENYYMLVNPHKPERKDEKARIECLGGYIDHCRGCHRVNGLLAVSRALGDVQYKPFVCAEPEIRTINLTGSEEFLVIGCDGLWDFVEPKDVIEAVYSQIQEKPDNIKAVSKRLVDLAKKNNSGDNISVIVVFFANPEEISKRSVEATGPWPKSFCQNGVIMDANYQTEKSLFAGLGDQGGNGKYEENGRHTDFMDHTRDDSDEDFGPETDIDAIDDVLVSPAKCLNPFAGDAWKDCPRGLTIDQNNDFANLSDGVIKNVKSGDAPILKKIDQFLTNDANDVPSMNFSNCGDDFLRDVKFGKDEGKSQSDSLFSEKTDVDVEKFRNYPGGDLTGFEPIESLCNGNAIIHNDDKMDQEKPVSPFSHESNDLLNAMEQEKNPVLIQQREHPLVMEQEKDILVAKEMNDIVTDQENGSLAIQQENNPLVTEGMHSTVNDPLVDRLTDDRPLVDPAENGPSVVESEKNSLIESIKKDTDLFTDRPIDFQLETNGGVVLSELKEELAAVPPADAIEPLVSPAADSTSNLQKTTTDSEVISPIEPDVASLVPGDSIAEAPQTSSDLENPPRVGVDVETPEILSPMTPSSEGKVKNEIVAATGGEIDSEVDIDSEVEVDSEWNYFKVESGAPSDEQIDLVATSQQIAETDKPKMTSLNPNAAEFIPVTPASTPFDADITKTPLQAVPRSLNDVVAESPKWKDMDHVNVPDEECFMKEIKSRPSNVMEDFSQPKNLGDLPGNLGSDVSFQDDILAEPLETISPQPEIISPPVCGIALANDMTSSFIDPSTMTSDASAELVVLEAAESSEIVSALNVAAPEFKSEFVDLTSEASNRLPDLLSPLSAQEEKVENKINALPTAEVAPSEESVQVIDLTSPVKEEQLLHSPQNILPEKPTMNGSTPTPEEPVKKDLNESVEVIEPVAAAVGAAVLADQKKEEPKKATPKTAPGKTTKTATPSKTPLSATKSLSASKKPSPLSAKQTTAKPPTPSASAKPAAPKALGTVKTSATKPVTSTTASRPLARKPVPATTTTATKTTSATTKPITTRASMTTTRTTTTTASKVTTTTTTTAAPKPKPRVPSAPAEKKPGTVLDVKPTRKPGITSTVTSTAATRTSTSRPSSAPTKPTAPKAMTSTTTKTTTTKPRTALTGVTTTTTTTARTVLNSKKPLGVDKSAKETVSKTKTVVSKVNGLANGRPGSAVRQHQSKTTVTSTTTNIESKTETKAEKILDSSVDMLQSKSPVIEINNDINLVNGLSND